MKKLFLLLYMLPMFACAQQVDIISPYIWCEEEVVDTAKAIAIADQIKAERKEKLIAKKERLAMQIRLLTSLQKTKQKKITSEQDKAMLQDVLNRCDTLSSVDRMINSSNKLIVQALEKGKIHKLFFNGFEDIKKSLENERDGIQETANDNLDFETLVSPLPMKVVEVKHENPYYADPNFHWLDKYDKSQLVGKTVSYPVQDEYWVSEIYTEYIFRQKDYYWLVYDQSNNLLAVSKPVPDADKVWNAMAEYDFENNAYDINKDKVLRDYVSNTFALGMTPEEKALEVLGAMRGIRMITKDRAATANMEKEFHRLEKLVPSAEVIKKGRNYLDQLKKDNEKPEGLEITRIDGAHFLITQVDGNLKAYQIYSYNKAKNKIEWVYKIIEK